jgi:cell division protein FtsZ
MIHFDLPKQKSSIIKVLGVGGGGSNAVNFMYADDIEGVDFIICNTDAKALEQSRVPNKIQLGPHLTQGLGAGANPQIGKQAVEESLDEIKRILEVNTKMAFICAGMGGGTGTGGAPIVAKICQELGILTVGIVTTPFGFEGPRRHQQAELGIKELKPYVDTLLVISNDKLRMQYGNLKMKEAFGKADNVLATAAKCITDIINSRGHIIVDFADVCTVMKNGGVAILGSSEVSGEDRAQRAIEEALSSPLLNDNDISGAKWVLININSAEGDHECTMDEVETINNHLRLQAGDDTDVIVGMGYDPSLHDQIGVTLIATGFENREAFSASSRQAVIKQQPKPEKIVMTLQSENAEDKSLPQTQQPLPFEEKDVMAPTLSEPETVGTIQFMEDVSVEMPIEEDNQTLRFELSTEITEVKEEAKIEEDPNEMKLVEKPMTASSLPTGGLRRPTNIYAEPDAPKVHVQQPQAAPQTRVVVQQPQPIQQPQPVQEQPMISFEAVEEKPKQFVAQKPQIKKQEEEQPEFELVFKDEVKEEKSQPQMSIPQNIDLDDEEEQKRRAAERLQKLRNLSFNMNSNDPNNEFDQVPAYVRRNMELFGNTLTSVENFYSKYTVKTDENTNETNISSLNTFLDGKKPD